MTRGVAALGHNIRVTSDMPLHSNYKEDTAISNRFVTLAFIAMEGWCEVLASAIIEHVHQKDITIKEI